jgi:hypothetical protein
MRAFYAYLIHERKYGEDTITKDGCLYQQFLVDAFANVEEDRLDYIRANQNDLRTELYQGINEAVLRGGCSMVDNRKNYCPLFFNWQPTIHDKQLARCHGYL